MSQKQLLYKSPNSVWTVEINEENEFNFEETKFLSEQDISECHYRSYEKLLGLILVAHCFCGVPLRLHENTAIKNHVYFDTKLSFTTDINFKIF